MPARNVIVTVAGLASQRRSVTSGFCEQKLPGNVARILPIERGRNTMPSNAACGSGAGNGEVERFHSGLPSYEIARSSAAERVSISRSAGMT